MLHANQHHPLFSLISMGKESCAQGKYGSTVPVSLFGCQLACEAALTCTAITYNEVLQQCFLKAGASTSTCKVSSELVMLHLSILHQARVPKSM